MRPTPELPCPAVTPTASNRQHGIEPLLSIEEVSQVLHISERGIYRLVNSGELARVKVGQRTLFDPADIRRFIESRRDASGTTEIVQVPSA